MQVDKLKKNITKSETKKKQKKTKKEKLVSNTTGVFCRFHTLQYNCKLIIILLYSL